MNTQAHQTKKFETVIGLEVHLQLNTNTKIFCGCVNSFGSAPNTETCPICLGLPGTLPVVNKKALEYAIKVGLALNCQINPFVKFDRKNYFYPDLPKGYQISQYDLPIARNGYLTITTAEGEEKKITIHRAHLEEDAGKLIHDAHHDSSLVDYNRTGTPLLEIVSGPDLRSAQEAYDYLQNLKLTLQYLHVSDCDMEKGSLRCDANISIRPVGQEKFGTKTELKNLNSFKAVKLSLEYEIERHEKMILSGQPIVQETRLWDDIKGVTLGMRSKEEAHDYRYFPEPDLVPFVLDEKTIDRLRQSLPELPNQKLKRFISQYNISEYDARIITQDENMSFYFEECAKLYSDTKKICNWLNGIVLQEINSRKKDIHTINLPPKNLIELIKKMDEGLVNNLAAKETLTHMLDSGQTADQIIQTKGLAQVSDDGTLEKLVDEILLANDKIVEQIKAGKESAAGFLVGQAIKKTEGRANPKKIRQIIKKKISHW